MQHRPAAPLFIVGVGRSGTSLLQAMLGSHSRIEFLPETGYLRVQVLSHLEHGAPLTPSAIDALIDRLCDDSRLARLDTPPRPSVVRARLDHASPSPGGSDVRLAVYECMLAIDGVRFAGDKDPRCIEWLDVLPALWPGCRIVHIIRDPRDVIASKRRAAWSAGQSRLRQLLASSAQFRMAERAERILPAEQLYTLRYEDLIAAPRPTLQALCDWLALGFETGMLDDFGATADRLVSSEEMQWKATTLGPLLTDNVGNWAKRADPFGVRLTERACEAAMRRGDYRPVPAEHRLRDRATALAGSLAGRLVALLATGYAWRRGRRHRALADGLHP